MQTASFLAKITILMLLVAGTVPAYAQRYSGPVRIHVGAEDRNGFVEADRGIVDAVKNLKGALRGKRGFRVVEDPGEAQVRVVIMSQGAAERDAGTLSAPVGNQRVYIPIQTIEIEAAIEVSSYRFPLLCAAESDRGCARSLAKDVEAWVSANRGRLQALGEAPQLPARTSPTCGEWREALQSPSPNSVQKSILEKALSDLAELVTTRAQAATYRTSVPERDQLQARLLSVCSGDPTMLVMTASLAVGWHFVP